MSKSPTHANEQRLTTDVLLRSVETEPGMDKRRLVRFVRSMGLDATHREVNRLLYGHPELFSWEPGADAQRLWYARAAALSSDRPADATDTLVLSKNGRWS